MDANAATRLETVGIQAADRLIPSSDILQIKRVGLSHFPEQLEQVGALHTVFSGKRPFTSAYPTPLLDWGIHDRKSNVATVIDSL